MTEQQPIDVPENPGDEHKKRRKSDGEKFFDWAVYGAMNYVGTFFLTLYLAFEIKHGALKTKYDWAHNALQKIGLRGKPLAAGLATFITFWGGNVMLLPVRLAESFKVGIASTLNRWMGDDTDPSHIKEAPKQTWATLIEGRVVAFATVFAMMFGANLMFGKHFNQFQKSTGEFFQRQFAKGNVRPEKAFHYGEIAALDMFATAASTVLLYVSSHIFARKREEKIERRQHAGTVQYAQQEAQETSPDAPRLQVGERELEQRMAHAPEMGANARAT